MSGQGMWEDEVWGEILVRGICWHPYSTSSSDTFSSFVQIQLCGQHSNVFLASSRPLELVTTPRIFLRFSFRQYHMKICHNALQAYRARAIKEGPFKFATLSSHFIRIQIFQIDIPPISSASKYFPLILYLYFIFVGAKMNTS